MKLSILTTITNPEQRQDKYKEAFKCYSDLADEVVVVNGGKAEFFEFEKKNITYEGKMYGKAVFKFINLEWPEEWNWFELPRHLDAGRRNCTGDWIIKMDIDQMFHEKDFDRIKTKLAECPENIDVATFQKMSMVYGNKYYQKGGQSIAFRNKPYIAIGKNLNKRTDLCFAIRQTGVEKLEQLFTYSEWDERGENLIEDKIIYDLPVGTGLDTFKTGIQYWNYDYFFKTKEFTKKEFWRFSRAYNRYFKVWTFGNSEEASFKVFLNMMEGRYNRAPYTYKLGDHPKYIREAVKNLQPKQFGFNGWGASMKLSTFDWGRQKIESVYNCGKHSRIINNRKVIKEILGRDLEDKYALRVFKGATWQGTDFKEATIIQNIFWIYGLAPRVLDFFEYKEDKHIIGIQIIEYIKECNLHINHKEVKIKYASKIRELIKIAKDNFIHINNLTKDIYGNKHNWRGDKYVDFGAFYFKDKNMYKDKLIKKIISVTHFGKAYQGAKASYQSIPDWELDGKRKTLYRIKTLKLDAVSLEGKSVIDIGCNLGLLMHYAYKNGAKRVVGYDLPNIVEVAREFANFNEIFDMKFYGLNLIKEPPKESADIVFFLAMREYLGFPKWLPEITNDICFYEGHAKEEKINTEENLKKLFKRVEYIGESNDRSVRPLFICYKK